MLTTMQIDRRLIKDFDWVLMLLTLLVIFLGLVNLYSATVSFQGHSLFYRQVLWIGIGFLVLLISLFFNYHKLEKYAVHLYVFSILLLIMVLLVGQTISGSKRWFVVGPISFQPSEIAKLTLIIMLARIFFRRTFDSPLNLREVIIPFGIAAIPFALILKEPDLGTALTVFFIFVSMILFVGIKLRAMCTIVGAVLFFLPLVWHFLKDYQKHRIITFIRPDQDPLGAGYHILQSKIAVGSGMLFGKGYMASTQSHLNFLPEHHTDFAFSVLAEEWGFAGSLLVVFFFFAVIMWGLIIARSSRDMYGSLVAFGVVSMFFWQVIINICMVTGMLPVVGLPLPFISYGGSSAVTNLLAIGLLLNISMRRFMFK
jgi:rod shape determining protein RodA